MLTCNQSLQFDWLKDRVVPAFVIATPDGKEVLSNSVGYNPSEADFVEFISDELTLSSLIVRGPAISREAIEVIAGIETLRSFVLVDMPITKEMLEPLTESPINEFSLWNGGELDEDIGTSLAQIPGLTRLNIDSRFFRDGHLLKISGPKSLQFFKLTGSKVTADGVREFVRRHPQIKLHDLTMQILTP